MDDLAQRIACAQQNNTELEQLISDYVPFIRKEAARAQGSPVEYNDRLSIAMLVFSQCVLQYNPQRGGFLSFASVCIRNRITDEARKHTAPQPQSLDDEQEHLQTAQTRAALQQYNLQQEQRALAEEIDMLAGELSGFGITFEDLGRLCPKQKRSRQLCMALARHLHSQPPLYSKLFTQKRLPQAELAKGVGVSEKTVEKYRKYVVALAVILEGHYPGVRSFIQSGEDA